MIKPGILLFLMVFSLGSSVSVKGQKITIYQTMDGKTTLSKGDTVQFLKGSLGGQFVYVFYMVGKVQKRKATFSGGYYTELIINHFLQKKERGEKKVYAVMGIPNKQKWFVWAEVEEALKEKEIRLK